MKTIFYLSILFVTVTMMSSCENELPFNINNNPPKLVMNALINAESTDNLLFLNFTSKENSTHVQNVTVEVRINGELKRAFALSHPRRKVIHNADSALLPDLPRRRSAH